MLYVYVGVDQAAFLTGMIYMVHATVTAPSDTCSSTVAMDVKRSEAIARAIYNANS